MRLFGRAGLVQVSPNPARTKERISNDCRSHMAKYGGKEWKRSSYGLQGYVGGRLLADALKATQGPLTGASVNAPLETMKKHAVSNLVYDFSGGNRQGIIYTDIGIIGSAGKLLNWRWPAACRIWGFSATNASRGRAAGRSSLEFTRGAHNCGLPWPRLLISFGVSFPSDSPSV